jgi:hypothetical protein
MSENEEREQQRCLEEYLAVDRQIDDEGGDAAVIWLVSR